MEIKYSVKDKQYIINGIKYGKHQLIKLIESEILENMISKIPGSIDAEVHETDEIDSIIGKNILFFGAPGTGKSYFVNKKYSTNQIRTVFHDSYTNSDFVGQYKPVVSNDGKVTYRFVPGPFIQSLILAYNNPTQIINLIIEEINRGNVSSIFGEIFNLLDRVKGESEYPINISEELRIYLQTNISNKDSYFFKLSTTGKIIIPRNLNIVATLNTSDQNVTYLDSAFKRRWEPIFVENDFSKCIYKDKLIGYSNKFITWEMFAKTMNNFMSKLEIEEDRHLGAYFVKETEIEDIDMFASKVIFYLWSDVFKFYRNRIFKESIDSFSKLRLSFLDGEPVFIDEIEEEFFGSRKNDNLR